MEVTRPLLRWHGGKWRIAPWILAHFPPHRTYVEPFGGAASVLLRKAPSYAEVYNDLDGEVVNLFRVMRGPEACQLIETVRMTPFARAEFDLAYERVDEPIERARRLIVRSFMGFGSTGSNILGRTGFRSNAHGSNTHPAADFAGLPEALAAVVQRLRGVVIENRPALVVMRDHDGADTLHYVDPPYMHELRSSKMKNGSIAHGYSHELTNEEHVELLGLVRNLKGMVMLSGYASTLYDEALAGWERREHHARDTRGQARREVLWVNPAAAEALHPSLPLGAA